MSIPPFPAAAYAEVTHEMLEAELMVVIRHSGVTLADLTTLFDRSFTALGEAMRAGLFVAVGPAIAVYHGDPQGVFDLEVGFPAMGAPTNDIPTGAGTIHASALPAGRVAIVSHVGSYDGLGQAWAALASQADGTPTGTWIEVYVSDPVTTPADHLRTDLVMPVR